MSFNLTHMICTKSSFKGVAEPNVIGMSIAHNKPNLPLLLSMIEKVGGDSNWHNRNIYYEPDYLNDLKERIEKTSANLWLFKRGKKTVGFCQTLNKEDLSSEFNVASGAAIEIYKIGLFPKYCGQGLGNFYVSTVLNQIFKQADTVYLNTRDTNKVNSVPFYERLGMDVIKTECKPDDLIQGKDDGLLIAAV